VQFEQWALAAAPRQPVFCGMLGLIRARLDDEARRAAGAAAGPLGGGVAGGGGAAAAAAAFGVVGGGVGKGGGKKGAAGEENAQDWGVLHRTGPHVWTDSVLRWMNLRGVGFHEALLPGGALVRDRRAGASDGGSGGGGENGGGGGGGEGESESESESDEEGSSALSARVMPPEAFGCAAHFFAADTNLEDVHVMHMFRGVWRARANDDGEEEGGQHGGGGEGPRASAAAAAQRAAGGGG